MYFKKSIFFSLLAAATVFTSCGKKELTREDMAKRIIGTEEPAMIMSANIKDILDKGGISSKENIPMVAQMLFSDKVDMIAKPEKAGIDVSGKSFFGMSSSKDGLLFWGITGIKEKEAFEKMLKEEGNEKFEELEGYNTVADGSETMVAWNEKNMLMVVSQGGKAKERMTSILKSFDEDEKKVNENYNKFFASTADGAVMSSVNGLTEFQKNMPSEFKGSASEKQIEMSLAATKKMKDCYSLFEMKFENDKITADFTNMLTPEAKKELDFMDEKGLPEGMLSMVGSKDILAFMSINGNVKKYMDYLKTVMNGEDVFAEASREIGTDFNNFVNDIKGNIFIGLAGYEKKEISLGEFEGKEEKYTVSNPLFCAVASTNGNYIMNFADSVLKDKKKDNYFVVGDSYNPMYLTFGEGYVKVTNSESLITLSGTKPNLDAEAQKALQKPVGFYVNLNRVIGEADASAQVQKIAKKFKYTFGGMDMNGGHAELHLNNGGKNALWTLINIGVESTADMAPSL